MKKKSVAAVAESDLVEVQNTTRRPLKGQLRTDGMDWRILDYTGHKMVYHRGGVRGYLSQVAFLPEEKIGIVVLQNSWNSSPFVYEFVDRYLKLQKLP